MNSVINAIKTLLNHVFSLWVIVTFSDGRQFFGNGIDFLHHLVFVEGYTTLNDLNEIAGFSLQHKSPGYPLVVVPNSGVLRDYAARVVGYATGLWSKRVLHEESYAFMCLVFAQASRYPDIDAAMFKDAEIQNINLTEKLTEELTSFETRWKYGYASPSNLVGLDDNMAFELLSEYLLDESAGIRFAAASVLGSLKCPQSIAALSKALGDEDVTMRREALKSIIWINSVDSREALEKARLDEDPVIRQQAEEGLRKRAKSILLWN